MSEKLVSQANVMVFGVLIMFLALIGFLTWDRLAAARSARQWTEHTYAVLGMIRDLEIVVRDAETGQRDYLLTGDIDYLGPYETALGRSSSLLGDLQRLTADNPSQQARLATLAPIWQRRAQQLAQTIQIRRDMGLQPAIQVAGTGVGRATTAAIDQTLTAMVAEEQTLLKQRLQATETRGKWVQRLVLAATAIAILALLWAARLLNQAYARFYNAETTQRALAGRLHVALDSLSQGVGVFGPVRRLRHWNKCFRVLLDLPTPPLLNTSPMVASRSWKPGSRSGTAGRSAPTR